MDTHPQRTSVGILNNEMHSYPVMYNIPYENVQDIYK